MLLDLFFGNETNTACPAFRRVVQDVIHRETVGVVLSKEVELLLQQNILRVYICVYEAELCAILRVLQSRADNLKHGCNSSAAGNHTQVPGERGRICELTLGAFDAYFISDFEQRNVLRDVSLLIGLVQRLRTRAIPVTHYTHLNEQVEVSDIVITACGSVAAHYVLTANLRRDGNMLANWETKDILGMRKRKAVAGEWSQRTVLQ